EQEMAGGCEHSRPRLGVCLVLPDLVAGLRIESADRAETRIVRDVDIGHASYVPVACRVLRLAFEVVALVFPNGEIKIAAERAVRWRVPVRGALNAGPDEYPLFSGDGV